MERTIHGPDKEHLTAGECASWLGVSLTTFKALVRSGSFPPPLRIGRTAARWPWLDVVSYAHLRSRMTGGDRQRPRRRP